MGGAWRDVCYQTGECVLGTHGEGGRREGGLFGTIVVINCNGIMWLSVCTSVINVLYMYMYMYMYGLKDSFEEVMLDDDMLMHIHVHMYLYWCTVLSVHVHHGCCRTSLAAC